MVIVMMMVTSAKCRMLAAICFLLTVYLLLSVFPNTAYAVSCGDSMMCGCLF